MNPARYTNQFAVYWAPVSQSSTGTWTYDTGREIKVRWEEKQEEKLLGSRTDAKVGNRIITHHSLIVLEELAMNGLLWRGRLSAWSGGTPTPQTAGVHPIMVQGAIPDRRAKTMLRQVWL